MKIFYLLLFTLFFALPFQAQHLQKDRAGEILVQLHPDQKIQSFIQELAQNSRVAPAIQLNRTLVPTFGIHLLEFDPERYDRQAMLQQIRQHPNVQNAQFNDKAEYRATFPNDPEFPQQWSLDKIKAPEAWDVTTGGLTALGDTIVIAVLDSGCSTIHEDMAANIWINHAETPDDGIDNDNNGYTDDYYGLFVLDSSDNHPDLTHGCAVAGIIGAKGDNAKGVAGINWTVKLMLISGASFSSEIVEAYGYAYEMRKRYNQSNGAEGAFVVATNYSAGIDFAQCSDYPIWGSMYDSLGQVGILSVGSTSNDNLNVDEVGDMPTSCPSDYLITVTNTDKNDDKVQSAGFGKISIDLGAPGESIVSSKRSDTYGNIGTGTSWSAPHVTGSIGLLYGLPCEGLAQQARLNPQETAILIRDAILDGVDEQETLANKTVTGGRLNIFNSISLLQDQFGSRIGPLDFVNIYPNPARDKLYIEYQTPEFTEYDIKVYNAIGQLMLSGISPQFCAPKTMEVPIFGLAPGTYFISIENVNNISSSRFIVY